MILTDKAIEVLKNDKGLRTLLALKLNVTETWINVSLNRNVENGILTTVAAISLIKRKTGMKQSEILGEELAKAV
jgi:hypothetical protein